MPSRKKKRKKGPPKTRHEPTAREICTKVRQAIQALEEGEEYALFIHEKHHQKDFDFLGTNDASEILDWALTFLHEIQKIGPFECFAAKFVERSYETGFKDLFLYPFKLKSEYFDDVAYLKFGIRTVESDAGKVFYYCHLDLHKDEPEKAT